MSAASSAMNSVEVRARVSGYLEKIHFTDGQTVKEGDLLFTIDKRPFQNTLDQARANLALAQAKLAFAEGDLDAPPAIGARQDHHPTDLRSAHAGHPQRGGQGRANEAAVRQAELDLGFTELRAPVPAALATGASRPATW